MSPNYPEDMRRGSPPDQKSPEIKKEVPMIFWGQQEDLEVPGCGEKAVIVLSVSSASL